MKNIMKINHYLFFGTLAKGFSREVFFVFYLVRPKVYLIMSVTSSLVYFEKVLFLGGIRLPDITVVGKATLSEKA